MVTQTLTKKKNGHTNKRLTALGLALWLWSRLDLVK